jgi:hypothetical protein
VTAERLLRWLWIGAAVQLAGRAIDGWWHATHDEFETAGDQLLAHSVLWIGVVVTLLVSYRGVTRAGRTRNAGYLLVLALSAIYLGAAAWHFVEHANGSDPEVAHVVLAVTWIGLLAGVVVVRTVLGEPAGAFKSFLFRRVLPYVDD